MYALTRVRERPFEGAHGCGANHLEYKDSRAI
jgi:hypothetical protein